MTSTDETGLQIIAIQGAWYRFFNAAFESFLSLVGTIAFMAAIFITPLPSNNNLYALPFIFMVLVPILALLRNKIIYFIFKRISHSTFLELVYFGRQAAIVLFISAIFFLTIGVLGNNAHLGLGSIGLLCTWFSLVLIFSGPLTYGGEIRLLFESLLANLDNFEKRQPYLMTISKKVENQLKTGNIKVPHNELVYYFNMELLKGTDIQKDLGNMEAWIVDKRTSCFESLKKIYPENKLEPWKRISLSRQFVENPETRKFILYIIALILLIPIAAYPALRDEISRLLKLLGI
jgi:hypothetical protein